MSQIQEASIQDISQSLQSSETPFPHLHLLVSGGNSQIIFLQSWSKPKIIGQTLDDAVGECLDKVGRMLGFYYPGGVMVAKIANLREENPCNFPVGMSKNNTLNYSFSGLKTSVKRFLQDPEKNQQILSQKIPKISKKLNSNNLKISQLKNPNSGFNHKYDFENNFESSFATDSGGSFKTDFKFQKKISSEEKQILLEFGQSKEKWTDLLTKSGKLALIGATCISVQTVAMQQLVNKFELAIKETSPSSLGLSGGVSANLLLRSKIERLGKKYQMTKIFIPPLSLTGDNAVMIGLAGLYDLYFKAKF